MTARILATVLLGGIAALDATPVAQTLLSQPLVTASLLGIVWGQWLLAVKVGIVLQLFSAGTQPVGARTPEDYATGGVIGAGTALLLASMDPYALTQEASAFAGCVVGMVSSRVGVPLVKWQRRRNEGLSRWCERAVGAGDLGAPGWASAAGIAMAFGVGVVFAAAFLAVSAGLVLPLVRHRSLGLARAWALAQPLWLGFGLAQLVNAFVQRRFLRAALFGVGLVAGWLVLFAEG